MNNILELKEIDPLFEENYLNLVMAEDTPTCHISTADYQLLIVRHLSIQDKSLVAKSDSYLIENGTVYRFNRNNQNLDILAEGFMELLRNLNDYNEISRNILLSYTSEIDNLEDYLYVRRIPRYFMDLWFDMKSSISKIDRFYERNILVIQDLIRKNAHLENFDKTEFQELQSNINIGTASSKAQLARLDNLHHYYGSIKGDRLNKSLYLLTVISGIFLPLNLIVGFFGMNTKGLFFENDPLGTTHVIYLIVGTLLFSVLFLKAVKIVDHYFLHFFLKKYKFYNRISKKIKSLEEAFEIDL